MINGVHLLIYSKDPDADRAFFRDVLEYPYTESGPGWLIFRSPPAEIGVHPTEGPESHELHFMCDEIQSTVDDLADRGVETAGPVADVGYGLATTIVLPGGGRIGLYEPKHPVAKDL
ncbi:MAG TPA: extradiol dioxygenase [Mycobacteriales bacterium]|nr:extradiol dioxygenase [Mycobacteriales bacterium]